MRFVGQYLPYASIELRDPSFGDSETYDTNVRFSRTRQGEPKIIHKDSWPVIETRDYVFETLTEDKVLELIDFLNETAGEPVYMTDYNDETFLVLITNNEYIITTLRDGCDHNVPLSVLILESGLSSESASPVAFIV